MQDAQFRLLDVNDAYLEFTGYPREHLIGLDPVELQPQEDHAHTLDRRRRLRAVVACLDRDYGRPPLTPRFSPVGELVYTVLSQNTADVNTGRTFAALTARYPTWSAVRFRAISSGPRPRRSVSSASARARSWLSASRN